jgi:hypothetical protein
MTDTLTPTPTSWQMFCKYDESERPWKVVATPGDDFLTIEMNALALRVRKHEIRATDLYDEIRAIQRRCVKYGFGEVHDTEPEWAICDFVNALCDEQGWAHVDRWEF